MMFICISGCGPPSAVFALTAQGPRVANQAFFTSSSATSRILRSFTAGRLELKLHTSFHDHSFACSGFHIAAVGSGNIAPPTRQLHGGLIGKEIPTSKTFLISRQFFIISTRLSLPPSDSSGAILSLRASLFKAVTKGDRKLVASLLASGADVNSQNDGGQTPIILAIISGHDHILPMLLDFGADPFIKDQTGLNAIDWAERKGRIDLVRGFQKDTQPKAPVNNETPPRPNTSSDQMSSQTTIDEEKSRRYIAGLLRRFEERPPAKPKERQRQRIERQDLKRSTTPDQSESANPQTESSTITAYETARRVSNDQPKNRIENRTPGDSEAKATDQPAAHIQSTGDVTPTSSRSARKRCPQCNTIYNSDLLTYCAYHVVPLVDADAPIVIKPDPNRSSVLLWTLVLFTLFSAAIATAYISGRLSRTNEKRTDSAPSQSALLQGIPAAKGGLAQKAILLPIAEAPLDATKQTATVEVRIKVNRLGQVIDASSSNENQILRESALAAAKRATFSAEKLNNRGAIGIITYTFNR
jgi:hypothetical protein